MQRPRQRVGVLVALEVDLDAPLVAVDRSARSRQQLY
jgi:hypothetical protein